jgi:pyruvate/2-oxoglutarate dehydrogenase complex dihydrolipoamide acyltransferase (E2) component
MIVDIVMPFLAETMEDGKIADWLKEVGDEVVIGEDLVEIETDKTAVLYQSDTAGVLVEITASEGMTVDCGEVIARIKTQG